MKKASWGTWTLAGCAFLFVAAVLVWQAVTSHGVPEPEATQPRAVALLNTAILVFREGLECVLVLAAIMASMTGEKARYRSPVGWGAIAGFVVTLATWFVAVSVVDSIAENVSALNLQAATGLLAIVVLLIVMNWFFHKIYWGGWIGLHTRRKRELLKEDQQSLISRRRLFLGLATLGFFSFYREGFEVVLFLQDYRLKMGGEVVLGGAVLGGILSAMVAVLTFFLHHRLPYRKMLILSGVLLGAVLLLMVGEQIQEMQLAGWITTTEIPALDRLVPDWMGMWFGIFPNVQGLMGQAVAFLLVAGSYFLARRGSDPGNRFVSENEPVSTSI